MVLVLEKKIVGELFGEQVDLSPRQLVEKERGEETNGVLYFRVHLKWNRNSRDQKSSSLGTAFRGK